MPHVFVYGTLRRGEINDIERLARRLMLSPPLLLGEAHVRGRLVDFGDWPGLVEDGDARILGEVYVVDDPLLAAMDAVEEYDPDGGSLFVRRPVDLQVAGQALCCHYYPIEPRLMGGAVPIDHDDWVAYRLARDTGRADRIRQAAG